MLYKYDIILLVLRKRRNNNPIGGGTMNGSGIEMRVFLHSDFKGTSMVIHLIVPMSFDFSSQEVKHQIYQSWDKSQCLPEAYTKANAFIAKAKEIANIEQIMLCSDLIKGNLIVLVINKSRYSQGIIDSFERLIKSSK